MSTKKKPASKSADGKSAADKGPQPLLKLKFEKFPDKPVAVYFEPAKRCFYADFGFDQYESPSVAGLEQKIKAAIKNGITPSPAWVPMIQLGIGIGHGRTSYKQALDLDFDVDIERQYFCIGKGGKLRYCGWEIAEKSRNNASQETYGTLEQMKPKALNAPIFKRGTAWDGGTEVNALIPYTDELWRDLGEHVRELRAQAAGLIGSVVAGKLDVFTNFIFDFEASTRPAAKKKPAPKPAAVKKPDPRQPSLPLAAANPIAAKKLAEARKGNADYLWLDMVIDLPPGPVPAELLAAAGFPADTTARKESSGDFWVNSPGTGQIKCVSRAEMQKLIRDRINGERGAKPQEVKKASSKKKAKAKKHNGDTTAREHLIVKYQGKQLTLGHGPLGNYLVEALRKTYPTIQSAFCLKDNSVQLSCLGGPIGTILTAADFERLINHPPHERGSLESFVNAGRNAQTAVDQVISTVQRSQGAIAKLHELVDAMQPEDSPLVIPGLILMAAGFPESASADMHSPDEIIVRVPKKAPQFLTLAAFEERIRQRIPAEAPEKELVGA